MKKYLIWVPVIGIFTTFYYQVLKLEVIVDLDNPKHFFGTAIWQAVTSALLILFLIHK